MKRIILLVVVFMLWSNKPVFAFNPITDFRDNLQWTFGQSAEVGEALKLWGDGDLENGETTSSLLASIAQYRFMVFSYGGTRTNKNDANFTDTAKFGFRLTSFFDLFKNPPTAEMAWMRDLNIGPSIAVPLISKDHPVALFLDINFQFGRASNPVTSQ
jgi:hypothetical protein